MVSGNTLYCANLTVIFGLSSLIFPSHAAEQWQQVRFRAIRLRLEGWAGMLFSYRALVTGQEMN